MGWFSHFQMCQPARPRFGTDRRGLAHAGQIVGWWADLFRSWVVRKKIEKTSNQCETRTKIVGIVDITDFGLDDFLEGFMECPVWDSQYVCTFPVYFCLFCGDGDKDDVSKFKIRGQKHTSLCLNNAIGRGLTLHVVLWTYQYCNFAVIHLVT